MTSKIIVKEQTAAFVLLPHKLQETTALKPKHLLVYAAIRAHMNRATRQAFPSSQKLARMLGMDRSTVSKLVKQLLENGAMTASIDQRRKTRTGKPLIVYHFPPEKRGEQFERIALPLLMNPQLHWELKAYIVALMPHLFKQPGQDVALTTYSASQIATRLNISKSAVNSYNDRLTQLGLHFHDSTVGQEGRLYFIGQMGQNLPAPKEKRQATERERQMQAEINELQQALAALRRQNADQQAAMERTGNVMSGVRNIPQKRLAKHILKKQLAKQQRAADADPFIMTT